MGSEMCIRDRHESQERAVPNSVIVYTAASSEKGHSKVCLVTVGAQQLEL